MKKNIQDRIAFDYLIKGDEEFNLWKEFKRCTIRAFEISSSIEEVSKRLGVSDRTVGRLRKQFDIPTMQDKFLAIKKYLTQRKLSWNRLDDNTLIIENKVYLYLNTNSIRTRYKIIIDGVTVNNSAIISETRHFISKYIKDKL